MEGEKEETREVEIAETRQTNTPPPKKEGEGHTPLHTHTQLCIMNILLAKLDERLIEVEDILWRRAEEQKKIRKKE